MAHLSSSVRVASRYFKILWRWDYLLSKMRNVFMTLAERKQRNKDLIDQMAKNISEEIQREFDKRWFDGIMVLIEARIAELKAEGILVVDEEKLVSDVKAAIGW
jgi:pantothenate kinase-related protein Tda10